MIEKWRIEQFKSAYDDIELKFAPLTVFTGANSSGKSTIIQSMLLTTQTLQNSVYSRSVVLNGHIIRLGSFEDIASKKEVTEAIKIGFDLSIDNINKVINLRSVPKMMRVNKNIIIGCDYVFTSKDIDVQEEITNLNPILKSCIVKLKSSSPQSEETEEQIIISRRNKNKDNLFKELSIKKDNIDGNEDIESISQYKVDSPFSENSHKKNSIRNPILLMNNRIGDQKPIGVSLKHFLPESLNIIYNKTENDLNILITCLKNPDYFYLSYAYETNKFLNKELNKIVIDILEDIFSEKVKKYIKGKNREEFQNSFSELKNDFNLSKLSDCFDLLKKEGQNYYTDKVIEKESLIKQVAKKPKEKNFSISNQPLHENIAYSINFIVDFFAENVKYLGPLRDEPKAVYPYSFTNDSRDVGYKGEHTAAVLDIHGNTNVEYIVPLEANENNNYTKIVQNKLITAVLEWLNYMGIVSNVKTNDKGKLGHELIVSTNNSGKWHDLTHVGVGVSQVLPILVLCLLAKKGSTLIFEQPELHLHPRVQTRLADFFVSMSNLGKQCVIETHSEYFINRLRYHSVISKEEKKFNDQVILYFVEKEGEISNYKSVKINDFGVIENWPKGFFDENEEISSAILKAAIKKRKKGESIK